MSKDDFDETLPLEPEPETQVIYEKPKLSFWQRLGGGSLSVSVIIHVILLCIGAVWVLRIIPPPNEKLVDFMPTGGGGGNPASQDKMAKKQASQVRPNLSRVVVEGAASRIALPEQDESTQMASLGQIGSGGMAGGMGGSGSGGGRGDGHGQGFGSGTGPGKGMGTGMQNPFGMINPNENALEGSFYDLKQTNKRKDSGMTNEKIRDVIHEFCNRGWKESILDDYYKASVKLYQTKLYIPLMPADAAPAAFSCEKEVQPSRWVVVYRGNVTPPRSGKYRFIGAGDDVLVVRFNNKHVFDHGFTSGTAGIYLAGNGIQFLKGKAENEDWEKIFRKDYPMKRPVTYYEYDSTRNWNGAIGGLAAGAEFTAEAGTKYPIEILVSEIPGGLFCASLLIEEVGQKYEASSSGSPVFPLFRLDNEVPPPAKADNAPPYDPNGPVWKRVPGRGKLGL
ncbi:hypothetical protein [Haloferula sp. BvORR071]|uniref:hypothetical protein n=1 Tax=Haloferula sp. BvORR071 TaxID=1396141 RepID=UPI000552A928|nr:hypothetical protein [Haloferula sp. BvORR071]